VAALDRRREQTILRVVGPLVARLNAGCTVERVSEIVREWAGPLAKWVRVDTAKAAKLPRRRALYIDLANPAVFAELRARIPELQSALKTAGIEEIRLR
jgi:hypothetical protein